MYFKFMKLYKRKLTYYIYVRIEISEKKENKKMQREKNSYIYIINLIIPVSYDTLYTHIRMHPRMHLCNERHKSTKM